MLTKMIVLMTLFSLAFSWTAFYERLERLRDKERNIKDKVENVHLKNLGLSNLKDLSLKDIAHIKSPDLSSKFEKLKHIIPKDLDPSHHKEVDEFWTGVFEGLKLKKPTELIECFGTLSGNVFFRKIRTVNELLQHSKEGCNLKLHTDYAQLEMLVKALEHTRKCMTETKDFQRLADSLDITGDSEALNKAKYLYYEAKFVELAEPFQKIVKEIDDGNFNNAGRSFAELFKNSVKDYKHTGEDLLAHQAFGNGLSGALGVSLPSDSLKCYNAKNAKILMDFFRGMSEAVTEGRWYKADETSSEYWESEGKNLLSKIPKKVWDCDMKSKETKEISEKLGIDIGSQEFRDKMFEYINDHNIMYYSYMRSMKLAIDKGDYLHAGAVYAHLIEAVAKAA